MAYERELENTIDRVVQLWKGLSKKMMRLALCPSIWQNRNKRCRAGILK